MTNIYSRIVSATVEAVGSKSKTEIGQARVVLKHPAKFSQQSRTNKSALAQPWLLDRLAPGDAITLDSRAHYKYLFAPLRDSALAERAAEIIGKCGQKSNYSAGNAQVYGPDTQQRWEVIYYKGSYKGYSGSMLYQDYQSCVGISASGRSAAVIQCCQFRRRIIAPAGMKFSRDVNGILLRRLTDGMDYHPTLEDYHARDFAGRVRRGMAQNWAARRTAKAAAKLAALDKREFDRVQKIKTREIGSVRVTLADSRRAGNCVEGSLRYCELRLHIPRELVLAGDYLFSVAASRLLASNGEAGVLRAVNAAWARETTISI